MTTKKSSKRSSKPDTVEAVRKEIKTIMTENQDEFTDCNTEEEGISRTQQILQRFMNENDNLKKKLFGTDYDLQELKNIADEAFMEIANKNKEIEHIKKEKE